MSKTRDEKVAEYTKQIIEGGWSSVYHFVDTHIEDWELDDDEEEQED
jgi:hypothetical protein